MNDIRNSTRENLLSRSLNRALSYNYRKGEILFRIIFDKYFRKELYNEINSLSVIALKRGKEKYEQKLLSNILWIKSEKLKQLQVDENIQDSNNLDIEKKSIEYLKKNLVGIRMQVASITFSSIFLFCFLVFYPFKRVRANLRVRVIFYFTLINIILSNTYLLLTVTTFNSMYKNYLEESYKKQIEKYNLILN